MRAPLLAGGGSLMRLRCIVGVDHVVWSLERGRADSAAAVLQSPPARRALGVIARLLLRFAAACGALQFPAHAATLPPPPVSPAPVTDYEYDAKGNLTKVIKGKGVNGFGFTTTNAYDALDRVKTNTDARNGVTALGYDGLDQLKQAGFITLGRSAMGKALPAAVAGLGFKQLAVTQGLFTGTNTLMKTAFGEKPWTIGDDCECR